MATPAGKDFSEDMKSGFLFRADGTKNALQFFAFTRKASTRIDPERKSEQDIVTSQSTAFVTNKIFL